MATSRLTFLYPHLFRTGGRWSDPAATASHAARSSRRQPPPPPSLLLAPGPGCCQHAAPFTTPSAGRQAAFANRAGKAIEPHTLHDAAALAAAPAKPPPNPPQSVGSSSSNSSNSKDGDKQAAQTAPRPSSSPATSKETKPSSGGSKASGSPPPPNPPATIELPPPQDTDPATQTKKGSPMDEILHRAPPSDAPPSPPPGTGSTAPSQKPTKSEPTTSSGRVGGVGGGGGGSAASSRESKKRSAAKEGEEGKGKPQQPTPPPYVHHFDSYTLVKQLTAGGFTLPQAIIVMKAIRTILASNLDAAQAGLVSKADMENETYLFRAACSELSAEVRNNRRVADEQLRQQRTMLQHEVDILAQRLNQELVSLNDSVRGMFNDRRMAVREEQKAVESRVRASIIPS